MLRDLKCVHGYNNDNENWNKHKHDQQKVENASKMQKNKSNPNDTLNFITFMT